LKAIRKFIHRILKKFGLENRRIQPENNIDTIIYSHLDEQRLISRYMHQLKPQNKFCVDIGANDGISMSNTYAQFLGGWDGLAIEWDSENFSNLAKNYLKFSGINLAKCKATPVNVCTLLEGNQIPERFGFLSLDIDGYDFFVLEKILSKFRPSLICVEINEKIPPPIKFTVKWDPEYFWAEDHFYGQSISQLYILCIQYKYSLVELHYNNAFLIPEEISSFPSLTPNEAYTKGYLEQPDRKEKFPWNANVEELLRLPPQEAVEFINRFFLKYDGKFICTT